MPGQPGDGEAFRLRRKIMRLLYEMFQEFPYAFLDMETLGEKCGATARDLNWNLVYLEKCGLIELSKSAESFPHVPPGPAAHVQNPASGPDIQTAKVNGDHESPSGKQPPCGGRLCARKTDPERACARDRPERGLFPGCLSGG